MTDSTEPWKRNLGHALALFVIAALAAVIIAVTIRTVVWIWP